MVEHSPDLVRALPAELSRWTEAGLITEEQAQAISAFEARRSRSHASGRTTRAIALLGALTLVSGVGSLIAYNWDRLGDTVKLLSVGVLLLVALGSAVRARQKQSTPVSTPLDVSVLVTSGLTLAGFSLVSQIYAQDGELWHLLFSWCALTAPLLSVTRSRFAHYFWFSSLFMSLMSSWDSVDTVLGPSLGLLRDTDELAVLLTFGTLSTLLAARFAASSFSGRASVGTQLYSVHLHAVGLLGGLVWFVGGGYEPIFWALGLVSIATLVVATPQSVGRIGYGSRHAVIALFSLGILLAVIPAGVGRESGVAAFVSFVLFWAAAWFLAEKSGHVNNARLAVAALGIRIVIASFELFESMLVTGTVLVGMGVAALVWSKFKWSSATEEAHHE